MVGIEDRAMLDVKRALGLVPLVLVRSTRYHFVILAAHN